MAEQVLSIPLGEKNKKKVIQISQFGELKVVEIVLSTPLGKKIKKKVIHIS